MEPTDTYKTIARESGGLYKEKGSRFVAFAYPVMGEEEIRQILGDLRKEYYDARHHCYAWRLGANLERYRSNDDGEPAGSAGKPILGQIQSNGLSNILIVVIRYFGGVKLGVSGLINAYRTAAADAIASATLISRTEDEIYTVHFGYPAMNDIMKLIKEKGYQQTGQQFDLQCSVTLRIRRNHVDEALSLLSEIPSVSCEFIKLI
jgi:uncharacterized YigZ family protein